jgi:hypothetical protein
VAFQEAPLLEAEEMESPEATQLEAEEMESPEAVASVAPRPEEVESLASRGAPDPEEVESPAASLRRPEEKGSRATPEVVGSTWWLDRRGTAERQTLGSASRHD